MTQIQGLDGFDEWEPWQGQGIPTRENCDLENPRQMFLWMFTALPGVMGAPLITVPEMWEMISFRMWQCGARLAADPVVKYAATRDNILNRWTAAGKWIDVDEPEPPRRSVADSLDKLSHADRIAIRTVLDEKLGLPPVEETRLRVSDLAERLRIEPDRAVEVCREFGIETSRDGFVDHDIADRIANHLGL
ncbi:DUF2744 domain-containing protein [Rhodococcus rhodnii]|uniref:DUF2744 domain-containing protein n=2 Tax=Rhodococcus rhodnii TaxID=38312 RepID=R7WRX9_9NOCA|nr:DUF2744 domain-containing protein [Rhodococcus rhodnii]EOM78092.1 hypothetical protein Rrhod_0542 [Rhodococcus rhodnii LMG 5362]TXG90699.1 DUF2744 domain-containing protein [Rhodococcus rhodnii]